ncbi:MAG: ribonuclease HI family protein [Patescibacteria group bacterium]|jgi:ribonuclease HI
MPKIYINTDGGARGNPGPAGIGVVFYDENEVEIHSYKEFIGNTTNNQAEYRAILKALLILEKSKWLKNNNNPDSEVVCRLDSQLVVEQINGNYKVKNEGISILLDSLNKIKCKFHIKLIFTYVPREQNKRADRLVNEALDEKCKK